MSSKYGPIIIVEDDPEDCDILVEIFGSLQIQNEIKFFSNGHDVFQYLCTTTDKPLVIISDVNMPKMNGIELRAKINADDHLRQKSIPFVFFTTSVNPTAVKQAYEMMVQGYFRKGTSLEEQRDIVRMIVEYWSTCKHPNSLF
jgi:CheY-like chemotaxis protein